MDAKSMEKLMQSVSYTFLYKVVCCSTLRLTEIKKLQFWHFTPWKNPSLEWEEGGIGGKGISTINQKKRVGGLDRVGVDNFWRVGFNVFRDNNYKFYFTTLIWLTI